jgi:hypothetical protein
MYMYNCIYCLQIEVLVQNTAAFRIWKISEKPYTRDPEKVLIFAVIQPKSHRIRLVGR